MKPIIGIITRPDTLKSDNKVMCIYEDIRNAVINSGGIPLGIMPLCDDLNKFDKEMYDLIDLCSGIILQGGDSFYKYDQECLKYIHEKDIPTLGICLGMQLMGETFDGKLINTNLSHLKKDHKYVHHIYLDKNSKLYQILKQEKIKVNSRHKEALKSTKLKISALSKDNVIEAIEDSNKKFFIGVQWHPESMYSYDILEQKIFDYFIKVCRK